MAGKLLHHDVNHLYNSVLNQLCRSCLYRNETERGSLCAVAVWAFLRLNWLQFAMAWNALIAAVAGGRSLWIFFDTGSQENVILLGKRRGRCE